MDADLRNVFHIPHDKLDLRKTINSTPRLKKQFDSWSERRQEEFLDFCTGARGIPILYDTFFKMVFSPEFHTDRIKSLIGSLLGLEIESISILDPTGATLNDGTILIISDIVVELADRSIVDVEIQKVGYLFPGQRTSCYSADQVMRQYRRLKASENDEYRDHFDYKKMRPVYMIVIMEKSSRHFKTPEFQDHYIHKFKMTSDTGLTLDHLENYLYISLDNFKKSIQSEGIHTPLQEWMALLCCDEPEIICDLISKRPDFAEIYQELYNSLINTEEVMSWFSDELKIMDQNTVMTMIEESEKEIAELQQQIATSKKLLQENEQQLRENEQQLRENEQQLRENEQQLRESEQQLRENEQQLRESEQQLSEKDARIKELEAQLAALGK